MQTTLFIHKPLIIFREDRDSFVSEVTSHSKVIFRFALSRPAIINTCTYTNLKHKCLRKDLLSCNPKMVTFLCKLVTISVSFSRGKMIMPDLATDEITKRASGTSSLCDEHFPQGSEGSPQGPTGCR